MDTDQLRVLIRVLCVYLWLKSVANARAFCGFFRKVEVFRPAGLPAIARYGDPAPAASGPAGSPVASH